MVFIVATLLTPSLTSSAGGCGHHFNWSSGTSMGIPPSGAMYGGIPGMGVGAPGAGGAPGLGGMFGGFPIGMFGGGGGGPGGGGGGGGGGGMPAAHQRMMDIMRGMGMGGIGDFWGGGGFGGGGGGGDEDY